MDLYKLIKKDRRADFNTRTHKETSLARARDAELVRLMAEFVGSESFFARDFIKRSELQAGAELKAAMSAANVDSAKNLGKFFQRIRDQKIGGYRLERQRVEAYGAVWRILADDLATAHSRMLTNTWMSLPSANTLIGRIPFRRADFNTRTHKETSLARARDAELLRLMAEFVGSESFFARDFIERSELQAGAELKAAMSAANVDSAKNLGKFFQRIRDEEIGGYRLERQRVESDGSVWRIWRE